MTFLSSRIVPSTPRSLVRLASRAASSSTGARQLEAEQRPRAAARGSPRARRAAARRRTPRRCRGRRPRRRARRRGSWWPSSGPELVPGSTSAPNGARRQPEPLDQLARPLAACARRAGRWSRRSVRSLASSPLSQRRAGRGPARSARAASSAAEPSSASSWKTVLIGIVWMPVTAYSSLGRHALERALDHPVGARRRGSGTAGRARGRSPSSSA